MSASRWSQRLQKNVEAPEVDAFLAEVAEVCRRHNMSISHEDGHGAFVVTAFDEGNIEWLNAASLDRDLSLPSEVRK